MATKMISSTLQSWKVLAAALPMFKDWVAVKELKLSYHNGYIVMVATVVAIVGCVPYICIPHYVHLILNWP